MEKDRILALWLLLIFLSAYFLTAPGHMWGGDGATRLELAERMVGGFGWTLKPDLGWIPYMVQGIDGRWYSIYGLGQSLAFIPFVLLSKGLLSIWHTNIPQQAVDEFLASFLNPIEGALLCVIFFLLLKRYAGYSARTSTWLSLILAFATFLWPNTRDNYDHIQATLLLCTSLFFILEESISKKKYSLILAGSAAGFAFLTRIDSILFFPALLLALSIADLPVDCRRVLFKFMKFCAGAAPLFVFFSLYNYVRFGNPLETGYGLIFEREAQSVFGLNALQGLYRFLLSPGRGLLIYSPIVLLFFFSVRSFLRRRRVLAWSGIAAVLTYVGFFCQFGADSPHCWGPRQLLPAIPMFILPAGVLLEDLTRRKVTLWLCSILILLSVLVQIPPVATSYVKPQWQASLQGASADDLTFNWHYFALQRQCQHLIKAVPATFKARSFAFIGSGDAPPEVLLEKMITINVIDWWWILLYWYGMKWILVFPISLVALIAFSALRMRRLLSYEG